MAESLGSRLKRAWNAFSREPTYNFNELGYGTTYRADRIRLTRGNEQSVINSPLNRIALDVAAITICHAKTDKEGNFEKIMDSDLNKCLTLEANIDQTSRSFIQDIVLSMFDEGNIAIVPVDTNNNPEKGTFDVETMRRGKIIEWYPRHVKLNVYNDRVGRCQTITMPKNKVAIVENPMYSVMNEPNSTLQRLKRKLNLLDVVDEQLSSGKLDIIIQLPYSLNSDLKKEQAEKRRKSIEDQLVGSKYGIAYIDGTERITQLNRPAENNLMAQVEYLTSMLYSQLGITTDILNGTASEEVMTNYYDRTIEPIISAIANSIKRTFLTKTAITQHQTIYYFRDPFRLVPVSKMADIADKFTRNEIMSSNEIRQKVGMLPSDDPNANELRNKNLNKPKEDASATGLNVDVEKNLKEANEEENQNEK